MANELPIDPLEPMTPPDETTPTGAEGAQSVTPPPVVPALAMGVPLPPPVPTPPVIPPSPLQSPQQKALTLGAIAAMLTGGQHLSGLGAGVLAGQQQLEQDRLRQAALADQVYQRALVQHDIASRQVNAIAEQRSRQFQGYLDSIRKQAAQAKSPDEYERTIQAATTIMNGAGFRVTPDQVRQAAGPYVAPTAPEIIQRALDRTMKNPATQELLKTNPGAVLNGTLEIDANGVGVPQHLPMSQALSILGLSPALGPGGQLTTTAIGSETPWKDAMATATKEFTDHNQRQPTTSDDMTAIYTRAQQLAKPTDQDAADLKKQIQQLDIAVKQQMLANPKANEAQSSRLDKSYQFNSTQLEKLRAPLNAKAEKIATAMDNLSQGTPQADALLAPEVLSVMAGGQGSGLRMNQAELQRIVGGRSNWENLRAAWQKWSLDPNKANSITPNQREQTRALLNAANSRLQAKIGAVNEANQSLVNATDVGQHRQILADVQQKLNAIDMGPTGNAPDLHDAAAAFLRANGRVSDDASVMQFLKLNPTWKPK